jgi:hypothetical protein
MQCHNENCLSHNDGNQRIGDDDDDGMMVVVLLLLMMMMIGNNNHADYCNILK